MAGTIIITLGTVYETLALLTKSNLITKDTTLDIYRIMQTD